MFAFSSLTVPSTVNPLSTRVRKIAVLFGGFPPLKLKLIFFFPKSEQVLPPIKALRVRIQNRVFAENSPASTQLTMFTLL